MTKKRLFFASIIILIMFLVAGCAAGMNPAVDVPDADGENAGFWSGLWHGLISPVTFFISLPSDNVNIYEVHNSGNWYDFGFIFGISLIFGGGIFGVRRKSK